MRPRSPNRPSFSTLFLWTFLVLGLPAGLLAAGGEPPTQAAEETGAEASPKRTFHVDGAVVTWDRAERRFKAPNAEQQARLAAELRRVMESGEGIFAAGSEEIELKSFTGGLRGMRLPLHLMSASVVRFDGQGHVSGQTCTDAAAATELVRTWSEEVE